jgi:hypothetical protein
MMMSKKLIWKCSSPVQTNKKIQKALKKKAMTINKTYKKKITKKKVRLNPTRRAFLA